jgi:hypothetical protein
LDGIGAFSTGAIFRSNIGNKNASKIYSLVEVSMILFVTTVPPIWGACHMAAPVKE